jgi:L-ascorbate metabolism protein UlaG (beta-lactamase superfamily)
MTITYLGHSCFKLRGSQKTVVIDPYDKTVGFIMPKTKTDLVLVSHQHPGHSAVDRLEGQSIVISAPGEYEVGGVSVFGLKSNHDSTKGSDRGPNTVFTVDIDGFRICHLGDLGHLLDDRETEELDGVDVLIVPVGGGSTLSVKQILQLVDKIDPKVFIPMHFRTAKHAASYSHLSSLDDFLKEWDQPPIRLDKLNLKDFDMTEESQLVILED